MSTSINARVAEAVGYGGYSFDPENKWDDATWALDVLMASMKQRPDDHYFAELNFGVNATGKWAKLHLELQTLEPGTERTPPRSVTLLELRDIWAETPALAICHAILAAKGTG
jgi:hypothetical protein